uniref:(northern house mosquito) hypothetical protein n=1 Tax=Culex pipiens TaxID=7175 RepID=A0A8D8I1Y4_CULPI
MKIHCFGNIPRVISGDTPNGNECVCVGVQPCKKKYRFCAAGLVRTATTPTPTPLPNAAALPQHRTKPSLVKFKVFSRVFFYFPSHFFTTRENENKTQSTQTFNSPFDRAANKTPRNDIA